MSDNRDHYYVRDAMGGHLGLIVDDDGDVSTPGHAAFTTYDAFGNALTERTAAAGAFAWRGGEGSVTEREPDLVYMQARHYSPKIGRFIQADTVLIASSTTQGFNRYAYVENDPVNFTDFQAAGKALFEIAFAIGGVFGAFYASLWLDAPDHPYLRKFFKFILGIPLKAGALLSVRCILQSVPRSLLYDAMGPGYSPPSANPLIPLIGLLAGYNAGALSYTLFSVIEDWYGN